MASAGGPGRPPRLLLLPLFATVYCADHLAFATQPLVRPPRGSQELVVAQQVQGAAGPVPSASQQGDCQAHLLGASVALVACAVLAAQRHPHGLASRRPTARRSLALEDDLTLTSLMAKYGDTIQKIRLACSEDLEGFQDTWVLRYAIEHQGDVDAAVANVKEVMEWRTGPGKEIVETATRAVAEATAGGGWNNDAVYHAAPHFGTIGKYLTAAQIVVVSLKSGDLCSCIKTAAIDDTAMMDAVSVEQLNEALLYAREVNLQVAEMRTNRTGRLVRLLAANDLSGVSKFPDSRFQEALTTSAKAAKALYPGLAGQTVILNLPGIVRLLVSFLAPLFPGAVQQRLKFASGPMAYVKDLQDAFRHTMDLSVLLREPRRGQFVSDLGDVLENC